MLELLRKYCTPILVGCLVLVALVLYSANLRHREKTTLFEKTILQLTAPFQKGIDSVSKALADWWGHYLWLVATEQENALLRAENCRLRAELDSMQEIRLANQRLRRLLEFGERVDLPALPAQVIAEDSSSWFRTVVIDKGGEDGVREGMPVVGAEGVIGRIIKSTPRQSRVLLITDASSSVASVIQRNRTRGVSRGRGDSLAFDFALRQKDIEVGDRVVTSGVGGVFPKGLLVGEVTRVLKEEYGLFQAVKVLPAVDFSRLEEVLVLLKDRQ
jgi:rod shape-determining protein MreC